MLSAVLRKKGKYCMIETVAGGSRHIQKVGRDNYNGYRFSDV
jgi:hypothetical protein